MVPEADDDGGLNGAAPARRSIRIALLLAIGFVLARNLEDVGSSWWLMAAIPLAIGALAVRARPATMLLALATLSLGAGWFTLRVNESPAGDLARSLDAAPRLIEARGMIVSEVRPTARRGLLAPLVPSRPSTTFLLDTIALTSEDGEEVAFSGALRVFVRGGPPDIRTGDIVRAMGMARGVSGPTNPGQIDSRPWARMRGVAGTMEIDSPALLTAEHATTLPLGLRARQLHERALSLLRVRARSWLAPADPNGESSSEGRALLMALALGQREAALDDALAMFQRAGLAHVLAVSGLHLMLLLGAAALLLRAIGTRPGTELIVLGLLVVLYLAIVPARAPIVRASIMALALIAGGAMGRRYDRMTMLGWAAVIVLLWRPMELWSMGFQLSFGVVAGLLTLTPALERRLFRPLPDPDHRTTGQHLRARGQAAISSSLCAWLIATPLVLHHVGIVAPLAALSVLIVMPIVTLLLTLAFGASIISVVAPSFGQATGGGLTGVATWLIDVVRWLDGLPGSTLHLPHISAAWVLIATIAIVLWIRPAGRAARRVRTASTLVALLWLVIALIGPIGTTRPALRIDTLDVADGSCHLLRARSSDGPPVGRAEAMLFDCGSLRLDMGQREIPRALRRLGVWRVRRVVISHANIDHFSALVDVAGPLGVREVLVGPSVVDDAAARPGGAMALVLDMLRDRGVAVRTLRAGDSLALGDARIDVLSPLDSDALESANDRSLVLLVTAPTDDGPRRVLLTGDVQKDAMRALLSRHPDLPADILEAPHHGSAHDDAQAFVRRVDPRVVVQSTGPSRLNDPRWNEIRATRTWLTTASDGAIGVTVRRDGSIDTRTVLGEADR